MVYGSASAAWQTDSVGILVSVARMSEFDSVLPVGVDVIDFKRVDQGGTVGGDGDRDIDRVGGSVGSSVGRTSPSSLAATDPELWSRACQRLRDDGSALGGVRSHAASCDKDHDPATPVAPRPRLSAALGELLDGGITSLAKAAPASLAFVKAGPAGITSAAVLRRRWAMVQDVLPGSTELVAVAYADHTAAGCIAPAEVLAAAVDHGMSMLLIDTHGKLGGNVVERFGRRPLESLIRTAIDSGRAITLAGGLTIAAADRWIQTSRPHQSTMTEHCGAARSWGSVPTMFGFRGAVCVGDRGSAIDADAVARLVRRRDQWRARLAMAAAGSTVANPTTDPR